MVVGAINNENRFAKDFIEVKWSSGSTANNIVNGKYKIEGPVPTFDSGASSAGNRCQVEEMIFGHLSGNFFAVELFYNITGLTMITILCSVTGHHTLGYGASSTDRETVRVAKSSLQVALTLRGTFLSNMEQD